MTPTTTYRKVHNMHASKHTYTHMHAHTHARTRVHTHVHAHTHTHAHTHIHAHSVNNIITTILNEELLFSEKGDPQEFLGLQEPKPGPAASIHTHQHN